MASAFNHPAPRPPRAGDVVGQRFRLEQELGAGGMGTVFAATDLATGASVALKLMRPELASDERAVERFRREGAALAAVRHPAIVQIREVGESDGTLYLAMERLEGETLSARLAREGPMHPRALLPIVLGLCDGLAAAHAQGVIHRDIKPSNVHLPSAEVLARAEHTHERAPVKLVDFGVARVAGFSKMTSSGLAIGTVRYMAPEQLTGSAIDERVDVYSLGVVLYEALAGEHPFDRTEPSGDAIGAILVGRATPLSSLRPDLPPAITRVVHVAMARLATERFASASALAEAFRQAVLSPDAPIGAATAPTPMRAPQGLELAPTEPAQPAWGPAQLPRVEPVAPASKPRKKPYWLLLPLLAGLCVVPSLGGLGFAGCASWMTDVQMDVALENVRAAIAVDPSLEVHAAELDRLEALHEDDRVDMFAAAAFNARVQHAMRTDRRLTSDEVAWVVEVVHDINERGGSYTVERYSEMTEQTRDTPR